MQERKSHCKPNTSQEATVKPLSKPPNTYKTTKNQKTHTAKTTQNHHKTTTLADFQHGKKPTAHCNADSTPPDVASLWMALLSNGPTKPGSVSVDGAKPGGFTRILCHFFKTIIVFFVFFWVVSWCACLCFFKTGLIFLSFLEVFEGDVSWCSGLYVIFRRVCDLFFLKVAFVFLPACASKACGFASRSWSDWGLRV